MVRNEEGCRIICCQVWYLLASQSRTPMSASTNTWVEVWRNWNGFHLGVTTNTNTFLLHLGRRGPFDQGCSFHTREDYSFWGNTSRIVYHQDGMFAWSSEEDSIWSRHIVYLSLLGNSARIPWYEVDVQILVKVVAKLKGRIKSWNMCFGHVLYRMVKVGTRICRK